MPGTRTVRKIDMGAFFLSYMTELAPLERSADREL
jgi:hypothetical protein